MPDLPDRIIFTAPAGAVAPEQAPRRNAPLLVCDRCGCWLVVRQGGRLSFSGPSASVTVAADGSLEMHNRCPRCERRYTVGRLEDRMRDAVPSAAPAQEPPDNDNSSSNADAPP